MWKIKVTARISGHYDIKKSSEYIRGEYSFTISVINHLCADSPERISETDVITLPDNTIVSDRKWLETIRKVNGEELTKDLSDRLAPVFSLSSFILQNRNLYFHYEIESRGDMQKRRIRLPSTFRKYTKHIDDKKRRVVIGTTGSRYFTEKMKWRYFRKKKEFTHHQQVELILKGERAVESAL